MNIIKNERIPAKFYFSNDLKSERQGTYIIKPNGSIEIEIFGWVTNRLGTRVKLPFYETRNSLLNTLIYQLF
jgi:hypothetical protein